MFLCRLSAAILGRRVFTFEPSTSIEYIKTSLHVNNLQKKVTLFKTALLEADHCATLVNPEMPPNFGRMIVKENPKCEPSDRKVSAKFVILTLGGIQPPLI